MPALQSTSSRQPSETRTMNRFTHIIAAALLLETCGCVTQKKFVIRDPVGPGGTFAEFPGNEGRLIVHSRREVLDATKSRHPVHTGYTIFSGDGKAFRRVTNQSGPFFEEPVGISLPPGTYKVEARATNNGLVSIPVVIKEGKTTVVYLDGETLPEGLSETNDSDWIRLPNGQIAGHRATTTAQPEPL
jgi:hypothetical protein